MTQTPVRIRSHRRLRNPHRNHLAPRRMRPQQQPRHRIVLKAMAAMMNEISRRNAVENLPRRPAPARTSAIFDPANKTHARARPKSESAIAFEQARSPQPQPSASAPMAAPRRTRSIRCRPPCPPLRSARRPLRRLALAPRSHQKVRRHTKPQTPNRFVEFVFVKFVTERKSVDVSCPCKKHVNTQRESHRASAARYENACSSLKHSLRKPREF